MNRVSYIKRLRVVLFLNISLLGIATLFFGFLVHHIRDAIFYYVQKWPIPRPQIFDAIFWLPGNEYHSRYPVYFCLLAIISLLVMSVALWGLMKSRQTPYAYQMAINIISLGFKVLLFGFIFLSGVLLYPMFPGLKILRGDPPSTPYADAIFFISLASLIVFAVVTMMLVRSRFKKILRSNEAKAVSE